VAWHCNAGHPAGATPAQCQGFTKISCPRVKGEDVVQLTWQLSALAHRAYCMLPSPPPSLPTHHCLQLLGVSLVLRLILRSALRLAGRPVACARLQKLLFVLRRFVKVCAGETISQVQQLLVLLHALLEHRDNDAQGTAHRPLQDHRGSWSLQVCIRVSLPGMPLGSPGSCRAALAQDLHTHSCHLQFIDCK
jgi:hypothetical protein